MIKKGDVVTYNRYKLDNGVAQGFLVLEDMGDECIIEHICNRNMKLQLTVDKADLVFLF